MKLSIAALLIAFAFLPQTAVPQQPIKGSIEGIVIRLGTTEPVADVQVTLSGGSTVQSPLSPITTDGQGKFAFRNLDAGNYRLSFAANGYVKEAYGHRAFSTAGAQIILETGRMTSNVRMILTPAGNVSGKIRDKDGHPLGGIPVQLSDYPYGANGVRYLRTQGNALTNDRGEYRIYLVTPGKYYLTAGGPPSGPGSTNIIERGRVENPNNIPESYAFMFYPNVKEFSSARTVEIAPAAEVGAIDLTLDLQKLYQIRGRIIDTRTGRAPSKATISIAAQPPLGGGWYGFSGYDSSTGAFVIRNLASGAYLLTGEYWEDLPGTGAPGTGRAGGTNCGPPYRIFADSTKITIEDSNVEDVKITLVDNTIRGRIRTDTPSVKLSQDMRVGLSPADRDAPPLAEAGDCVKEDGTFTLKNIKPGEYRIGNFALPFGAYVKEMRFGGADVLNSTLKYYGPGPESIEIMIGSKPARISGLVSDDNLQPYLDAQIVLAPARNRSRADLYQVRTSDRSGNFTFTNVPPGDYKLFAWEDIERFSWFDPEVLKPVESRGTAIHVEESGNVAVNLKVITTSGLR